MPAALSLLLGLVCLGFWPLALMPNLVDRRRPQKTAWRTIGLVTAAGLLLNACLVVLVGRIEVAGVVALAFGTLACAAVMLQQGPRLFAPRLGYRRAAIFLGALALLSGPVLLAPLNAWDARSIWFFQAKIIFHGGLVQQAGWDVGWSHPDYPKLLPILAAQVAYLAGFWNEQLPKAALLLLSVPLLATSVSLVRSPMSLLTLAVLIWWPAGSGLSNGYADSYLALYGALGVMLIGAWATNADPLDLVGGVVFLAVCCCLKNEGALLDICALVALITGLAMLAVRRPGRITRLRLSLQSHPLRLVIILSVVIVCCVAWPMTRSRWGLHNDLKLGPASLILASKRLSSPDAILLILRDTLWRSGLFAAASCGAAAVLYARHASGARVTGLLCLATAALYQVGITLIYLSTPNDLAWHLSTSADRTSLLPTLLCLAPIFLYLRDADRAPDPQAGSKEQFLKA